MNPYLFSVHTVNTLTYCNSVNNMLFVHSSHREQNMKT